MTELSPEAFALLEAARRSHGPSEPDRERVLTALHASLGIAVPLALAGSAAEAATEAVGSSAVQAAGVGQATSVAETAAQLSGQGGWSYGSKLLTWKAGKIFLATVALGSAVGVATLPAKRVENDPVKVRTSHAIARPAEREHASGAAGTRVEPPVLAIAPVIAGDAIELQQPRDVDLPALSEAVPRATASSAARVTSADGTLPVAPAEGAVRAVSAHHRAALHARTHRRHGGGAASHSAATAPAVEVPTIAEAIQAQVPVAAPEAAVREAAPPELELIRKAMTSLRDRDATRALLLLDEHASRYPHGAFASERSGLHVIALCAAGRVAEGQSEQQSFLREHGETPIAARVRRACAEPKQ